MRQIAGAVISYATENKGFLPKFQRRPQDVGYNLSWAGLLVQGKYIDAPLATNSQDLSGNSVFRCPSGRRDGIWGGGFGNGPWTSNPEVHRPWASAHDIDGTTYFVHVGYGLNARTENGGWPFVRWGNDTSTEATVQALRYMDNTVMLYDGVWCHNSTNQRIYARHGVPVSFTNFCYFDGRVITTKTKFFDVGGGGQNVYPRFRQ
jgi:hypothetical protein